jgi:hypothetical protein
MNDRVNSLGSTSTFQQAMMATTGSQLQGIYVAKVIDNVDANSSGKLLVTIPDLQYDDDVNQNFHARWTSPFAGSTNPDLIGPTVESFDESMKTYGMWMQPPDIGNLVLVCFPNKTVDCYIITATLPDQFNYMIPGMPGGSTFQAGSFNLPTSEKNKLSADERLVNPQRPAHHPFAEAITKQGLINDPVRGISSSGAKRESPSDVFGILTKGIRDPENQSIMLQAGHQFIMDDNADSKNIRLRTGGGNQILLDDTNGIIYLINKDGKAWVELDMLGNINFFGEGDISFRAKKNFNLRADKNINIEAGQDLNLKATGDNMGGKYMGIPDLGILPIPPLGVGGNIRIESTADTSIYANLNAQLTAGGGDIDVNAAGSIRESGLKLDQTIGLGGISTISMGAHQTISALGTTLTSAGPIAALGSLILLNSGAGPTPIPAIPAIPAPQIGASEHQDQSSAPPEYKRDDEVVLPNGGQRPEQGPSIKSIVGTMITAEPYDGHAQYTPESEDPESLEEDESADNEANPEQAGLASVTAGAESALDSVTGAINDAKSELQGELDGLKNLLPAELSNFDLAGLKNLQSIDGMMNMANSLGITIPPLRFPTSNALSQKIIGQVKKLQELEAELSAFALDIQNKALSLQDEIVGEITGKVDEAVKEATDEIKAATTKPATPPATGG